MQKTANELVSDAYLMAGLRSTTDTLGADDAAYGLTRLNGMLDGWATDALYVKVVEWFVQNIPAGQTFTVGPGGDVDTDTLSAPPMMEPGAFVRYNSVDEPITLIDLQTWAAIPYKATSAPFPNYLFYDPGAVTSTAYIYPATSATAEFHIPLIVPLGSFAALTTSVDLPQGYADAISMSLAELLCIGIKEVAPTLAKQAAKARGRIKAANTAPPGLLTVGLAGSRSYSYNWLTG